MLCISWVAGVVCVSGVRTAIKSGVLMSVHWAEGSLRWQYVSESFNVPIFLSKD